MIALIPNLYCTNLIYSLQFSPEDDQSILIETSSCNQPVRFRTIFYLKVNFYMCHSLYLVYSF